MSADQLVRVVPADRERVNRIPAGAHDLPIRVRNGLPLRGINPEGFVLEEWIRAPVELPQVFAGRLNRFAPEVDRSELL